ncbi:MAG: lytic transglycosylase domain-containing protein [Candidatus Latescibacteria bacterium]|nr:lytic transglycosylase domain-containing protein [Candidatus Latescibacterota bacterium]MBT5832129.1 lytic transglycosylase domain-containing protein [Candidatus Latescibacterota bacterium]
MRLFFLLGCFAFLTVSVQAENTSKPEVHPDAFVKRSYTPTFAQLILARSTGRPYMAQPIEAPQVIEAPEALPASIPSPTRNTPVKPSKAVLSKPAFSGSPGVSQMASSILKNIEQYDVYIRHYSRIHNLDPNLVRAVIYVESAGDPDAVSVDGAMGLMQLMPATASDMGVKRPHDPAQNIFGGTRYLSRLVERFGSLDLALWAYNAGPELVKRKKLPLETRRYIPKVMRIKHQLEKEGI